METACFGFLPPRGYVLWAALTYAHLAKCNQWQVEGLTISQTMSRCCRRASLKPRNNPRTENLLWSGLLLVWFIVPNNLILPVLPQYQKQYPISRTGFCSRFLPVKRETFLDICSWRFKLWLDQVELEKKKNKCNWFQIAVVRDVKRICSWDFGLYK